MKKNLAILLALVLGMVSFSALADTDVTIGVTGAFYEDLWQPAIDQLNSEGIHVKLQQFNDFSIPNNALNDGEIDMNAFQHHAGHRQDHGEVGCKLLVHRLSAPDLDRFDLQEGRQDR